MDMKMNQCKLKEIELVPVARTLIILSLLRHVMSTGRPRSRESE